MRAPKFFLPSIWRILIWIATLSYIGFDFRAEWGSVGAVFGILMVEEAVMNYATQPKKWISVLAPVVVTALMAWVGVLAGEGDPLYLSNVWTFAVIDAMFVGAIVKLIVNK